MVTLTRMCVMLLRAFLASLLIQNWTRNIIKDNNVYDVYDVTSYPTTYMLLRLNTYIIQSIHKQNLLLVKYICDDDDDDDDDCVSLSITLNTLAD